MESTPCKGDTAQCPSRALSGWRPSEDVGPCSLALAPPGGSFPGPSEPLGLGPGPMLLLSEDWIWREQMLELFVDSCLANKSSPTTSPHGTQAPSVSVSVSHTVEGRCLKHHGSVGRGPGAERHQDTGNRLLSAVFLP